MFSCEVATREYLVLAVAIVCFGHSWKRKKDGYSTSKAIIYKMYSSLRKRMNVKSKYRGPPKLTSKTAEATSYSEHTVRKIVAKKAEISEAAFMSLPKRYKVERKNDIDTEAVR